MAISQAAVRHLIKAYFDSFNQGDFERTAALFAASGQLIPPFEGATVGPENILLYLKRKARNMVATPQQWAFHQEESHQWQVEVMGQVQALVFQVTVTWQFTVTQAQEIAAVRIKLMASPQELLSLRSVADSTVTA